MDELLVPGTIALLIFYAGIVLVVYGIFRLVLGIAGAFLAGNFLLSFGILAAIAGAGAVYILAGLWLRRIEVI
jgi:uncharacterized membrane protein (DUF485 family)